MDYDTYMDIFPRTISWNPWHGCRKVSRGCLNCYMFEGDRRRGVPGSDVVTKSKTQFDLPIQKDRNGRYKLNDMLLLTSMTSDFFIEEADEWRDDAWRMMSKRKDLTFEILTKRPHRIMDCLPDDWGDGYPNVRLSVSAEDQDAWDERVPILLSTPAVKRDVYIAPIIGPIDVGEMLSRGGIDAVYVGGEYCSKGARPCDFEWVRSIREECVRNDTTFIWRNTGTYLLKDGETFCIESISEQGKLAASVGIDYIVDPILPSKRAVQSKLF